MTYDSLKYAVCDVWDESLQRWIFVSKVEGAVDVMARTVDYQETLERCRSAC